MRHDEGMTDLADLWDFDDPAASERRFRAAATGDERPVMLTQVARALGLQGSYDAAHELLHEVAAGPVDEETRVRLHLERGRLHRSAGDPVTARPEFDEAAELAEAAGLDALHLDALHMQALVAEPDEAVAITERALALAAVSDDERARNWDASLLTNLGMMRVEAGNLDGALETFEDALSARVRIGVPADIRVARWMVAWVLRLQGRDDEARAIQRALKAELDAAGTTDPYVDEELGLLGD